MNRLLQSLLFPLIGLTLVAAPLRSAQAQDNQVSPAVVVSIAPIDEQFKDLNYLATAGQLPDIARFYLAGVQNMVPLGIDRSKPIGVYMTVEALDKIQGVAFVGVTNLDQALNGLKPFIANREKVNGLIKVTLTDGKTAFVKQQGGWAFVSQTAESLGNVPKDPAALVGGLAAKYNVAVQVKASNVPKKLKAELVATMKAGFADTQDRIRQQNPEAAPFLNLYGPTILKNLEQLVTETDSLMYGIAVDQDRKSAYLDASITALDGTEMADELAALSQLTSDFSGFAMPDAAASLNITTQMAKSDVQMLNTMLAAIREAALNEVGGDANLSDAERTAAKEVLGSVFDVLQKTISNRNLDGGASLLLGDGPGTVTFIAGGHVADGPALDKVLRTIVEHGKKESPELRAVKFDAAKHAGVTFHQLTYDVPDDEGRKVFGDSVEMAVGVGAESIYFAFGRDTIATLKKAIDASAKMKKPSTPMKLTVSLAPMFKFGAAVSGDGQARKMADVLESFQDQDRVEISVEGIERGMRARLELQEGALTLIGKSLQGFMQQRPGGRPPF